MTVTGRSVRVRAVLVWIATGVVVTAPIWLIAGVRSVPLVLLGPVGILLFKLGDQMLSKLVVVALMSSPTVVGITVAMRKWSGLSTSARMLCIIGLSTLWHGIATGLWLLILAGFN